MLINYRGKGTVCQSFAHRVIELACSVVDANLMFDLLRHVWHCETE